MIPRSTESFRRNRMYRTIDLTSESMPSPREYCHNGRHRRQLACQLGPVERGSIEKISVYHVGGKYPRTRSRTRSHLVKRCLSSAYRPLTIPFQIDFRQFPLSVFLVAGHKDGERVCSFCRRLDLLIGIFVRIVSLPLWSWNTVG